MDEQTDSVILINAFEVPAGEDDNFIRGWERARDFLRRQPGFVSTALHQSLAPDADFRFVNVAHWESAEAFRAAMAQSGFRESGAMPYQFHPALYRVVRQ
jgi:heme-degrading monooxygenase HmoA